jgi:exopolysaccharide biosynthesis polyprenyl glycosylphosphotransferase
MTTNMETTRYVAQSKSVSRDALQSYPAWHSVRPFSERRLLLIVMDAVFINSSIALALFVWNFLNDHSFSSTILRSQWLWFPILTAAWWIVGSFWDLYDLTVANQRIRITGSILAASLTLLAVYLATYFIFPRGTLPRIFYLVFIITNLICMTHWRILYATFFRMPQRRRRTLIVGAGEAGQVACELLKNSNHGLFDLIGFVDSDRDIQGETIEGLEVLGTDDDLLSLAHEKNVDKIVVAYTQDIDPTLFDALVTCQAHNIRVTLLPDLSERYTQRVPVEYIDRKWALDALKFSTKTPFLRRLSKRLFDIVAGLTGMVVFGLLFPFIALAIKLEDGGPIFYVQTRAGLCGKPYKMRKFRTMRTNAESGGAQWARANDDRITKVGCLLRKCRMDELPQVLNILRGEMSIVGPRPERPEFINELEKQIPFYRMRLAAKPGLTGWAQIHFKYGNSIEDTLIKLEYDLYYIKHQSLWLDLYTILRTLGVVLEMKGM